MNFANKIGYSDITPYEVLHVTPSKKVMCIREMLAVEQPWMRQYTVGGFLGHLANGEDQTWDIHPDEDGDVVMIRQHKDGKWYDKYGTRYALADSPRKFYDYNF